MCTSECSWHSSRTCLSPSVCVLRGLWHLCVLGGISAEYLSHVHGQTLGHGPQIVVKTAGLNTQTRAIGFQRRIWAGRASIFLHVVRSWPPPPPPGLWGWDCASWAVENTSGLEEEGRRSAPLSPERETLVKTSSHQWSHACCVLGSVARTSGPLLPVLFLLHP